MFIMGHKPGSPHLYLARLGSKGKRATSYNFSLCARHAARFTFSLHTAETWSCVDSKP